MKVSNLLRSLSISDTAAKTVGLISDNFDALRKILQGKISLADNVYCDVITGTFDHGQPTPLPLSNLISASGILVLGSSVPCVASPHVATLGGQANATLYFAGSARQVKATVVLFDSGYAQLEPGNLIASTIVPGQVTPDGNTIFISPTGVISAAAGGRHIVGEVPVGPTTTTNPNDTYTLAHTPTKSIAVYAGYSGYPALFRIPQIDPASKPAHRWDVSGKEIIFANGFIPTPTDGEVLVDYEYS